jgi:hypothetical protein
MQTTSRFDIDQLRRAVEALRHDNPELADDEVLRADMLEGATDLFSALTTLVDASADAQAMMAAMTERLKALSARRANFGRRVDGLRSLMLTLLQAADLPKIVLPDATLSQRKGVPQIVGEVDADKLPDDLCRIKREPDLDAIRAALSDHREVPGLALSNAPPTLMIKVR